MQKKFRQKKTLYLTIKSHKMGKSIMSWNSISNLVPFSCGTEIKTFYGFSKRLFCQLDYFLNFFFVYTRKELSIQFWIISLVIIFIVFEQFIVRFVCEIIWGISMGFEKLFHLVESISFCSFKNWTVSSSTRSPSMGKNLNISVPSEI